MELFSIVELACITQLAQYNITVKKNEYKKKIEKKGVQLWEK